MKHCRALNASRRLMKSLITLLLLAGNLAAQRYPPGAAIDVLHYSFSINLSDSSDQIHGRTEILLRALRQPLATCELNLSAPGSNGDSTGMTVSQISDHSGRDIHFDHRGDNLTIQLNRPLQRGDSTRIIIYYSGIPADGLVISRNKYGERTFFADNWPFRARKWLPVVDHPADKATCEFIITAPNHYQVVANGLLVEESDIDKHYRRSHWHCDSPLPTKIMVIGVARFAVSHYQAGGIPLSTWVYPQDRKDGFYDFAIAGNILQYFQKMLGPYPFKKLANVQSKTRYGGMENAGTIFYNENSISGHRGSEGLIAHEIAHQWFGDAVTESHYSHIWLSEGFASYLTQFYFEDTYGPERLEAGMRSARRRVLAFQERHPQRTVIDTAYNDANRLLNPLSYQKGAWVLHMLRYEVGDSLFWEGLRQFYRQFRNQNADTQDFRKIMESVSGKNLKFFFRQWLQQPGQPELRSDWGYNPDNGVCYLSIEQVQMSGIVFKFPLEIGLRATADDSMMIQNIKIDQQIQTVALPVTGPPEDLTVDPRCRLLWEED